MALCLLFSVQKLPSCVYNLFLATDKGFVTGGKDGAVILWDETCSKAMRKYDISKAAVAPGSLPLVQDKPPIRAVVLGQVCAATEIAIFPFLCD